MTGRVPYYGGRFTPAQAFAAAHPAHQPQAPHPPAAPGPAVHAPATPPPAAHPPVRSPEDPVEALRHLLRAGVLTQEEFDELRSRVEQ